MNLPFLTQAADGLPRRGFTNRELARMVEAGVIDADEPIELIRGEIVPMAPELDRHVKARTRLQRIFARALDDSWCVASDASLYLTPDTEIRPDLHIFPMRMKSEAVRGPDVVLAVELSSSTQKRDLELKAPLYVASGVEELWVLDLDNRSGVLFRRKSAGAPLERMSVTDTAPLTPRGFPDVTVTIAALLE